MPGSGDRASLAEGIAIAKVLRWPKVFKVQQRHLWVWRRGSKGSSRRGGSKENRYQACGSDYPL